MQETSLKPWKSHTGRLVGQITQCDWVESTLRRRPHQAETFIVYSESFPRILRADPGIFSSTLTETGLELIYPLDKKAEISFPKIKNSGSLSLLRTPWKFSSDSWSFSAKLYSVKIISFFPCCALQAFHPQKRAGYQAFCTFLWIQTWVFLFPKAFAS